MITGAFYEPTVLNIPPRLVVKYLVGEERIPVSQLTRRSMFLGHGMKMLAKKQVFCRTEYESDVFANKKHPLPSLAPARKTWTALSVIDAIKPLFSG